MIKAYETLNDIGGTYIIAATFGNVHGVYKPGNVKLRPTVLRDGQEALKEKYETNNLHTRNSIVNRRLHRRD